MTINIAPPPLQIPPEFVVDKTKAPFFQALVNTLFQIWTSVYQLRQTVQQKTTDASATGLIRVPVDAGHTVMIQAHIVARRTAGAGAEGDSAWYVLTGCYKNVAGVLTGIGVADIIGGEDVAGWGPAFTISGQDAVVFIVGAAATDITWNGTYSTYEVGA